MSAQIEVFLNGGVGNQLFGLAAGQALALKLQLPLTLNISNLEHRSFQLNNLKISNCTISTKADLVYNIHNPIAKKMYINLFLRHGNLFEKSFQFDHRFNSIALPTRLHGYFQSYKYFLNYEQEIKQTILNPINSSSEYQRFVSTIDFSNSIAIHLRRGDYLEKISFHGIADETYYRNAIGITRSQLGEKKFFVFTDDLIEARRFFPDAEQIITERELPRPMDNILLMSHFSAIIGANSSFSYWSGILSGSRLKIFPRNWFANSNIDTRDLLPEDFIRI